MMFWSCLQNSVDHMHLTKSAPQQHRESPASCLSQNCSQAFCLNGSYAPI